MCVKERDIEGESEREGLEGGGEDGARERRGREDRSALCRLLSFATYIYIYIHIYIYIYTYIYVFTHTHTHTHTHIYIYIYIYI